MTFDEIVDLNTCRTCLYKKENMKSIFSVEQAELEVPIGINDMLKECVDVQVRKEEDLPQFICCDCAQELRRLFIFRKMCKSNENLLRNKLEYLKNNLNHNIGNNYRLESDYENSKNTEEDINYYIDHSTFRDSEINTSKEETTNNDSPVKRSVNRSKSYNCNLCNKSFKGLALYWKHMTSIHGEKFKCEYCDQHFKLRKQLKQHVKLKHPPNDNITTEQPKTSSPIRRKSNSPHTCEICKKSFRFHSNLQRHKLIHTGEKPFLCNVCGKAFGQMSYLKIHSFIHTGEKPYKCQLCEKSFAAPGTLMTHVRIHTGERPHVCKICGKDFPQSGYLSAHIRTHTGEKPVECKICHQRFNQSSRLIIHMRIHSGERPFKCTECGQSFAVKGTLKKHIRTHTGERPYVCNMCGQAFAQSGTLSTHMKVHKLK